MSIIPSSVSDRQKLKSMLVEITASYAKIDAEKDHVKEILDAAQEQFEVKKKLVTKLAKTMYKRDYSSLVEENEHFQDLYEILVEGKKSENSSEQ